MITKEGLSKAIMRKQLPRTIITIERGLTVPNFQKIAPLEALVDREGWKMSMLKGMYIARMPILIQGIWLKGSYLT
jgi:hypothetical protein